MEILIDYLKVRDYSIANHRSGAQQSVIQENRAKYSRFASDSRIFSHPLGINGYGSMDYFFGMKGALKSNVSKTQGTQFPSPRIHFGAFAKR